MNKFGFTLIEMLLVMGLLSISFFPLMLLFSNGIIASSSASQTLKAIALAQQKIEEISNLSYSNIVSSSEAQGTISSFPTCSRSTVANEISPNLKDISVTVSWINGAVQESFDLKTYIANY